MKLRTKVKAQKMHKNHREATEAFRDVKPQGMGLRFIE
jgi:hypothetical protein